MASYADVVNWVKANHGFAPKTCWIAHVKSDCGLPMRDAPNRIDHTAREHPCPPQKRAAILDAFRHFKMI